MNPPPKAKEQFTDACSFHSRQSGHVLALGVDLKHALCLSRDGNLQLSSLAGNLNVPEVYAATATFLDRLQGLDAVACDLHPDLHSTQLAMQLAERLNIPLIQLQHHHAHIAAVMAEHGLEQPVIGLAMDGFGYGSDGSAWGGECLYVNGAEMERSGHLKAVAMPGGDAASREPWRMAVSWLDDEALSGQLFPELPVTALSRLCQSELTPLTSSGGRLFDAASAIVLAHTHASFEGEAAIKLEQAVKGKLDAPALPYDIKAGVIDMTRAMRELAVRRLAGDDVSMLAASFHATVAEAFSALATERARQKKTADVVLAGGCFLNQVLEYRITTALQAAAFRVWKSDQVARGDGGIALGQAWLALAPR